MNEEFFVAGRGQRGIQFPERVSPTATTVSTFAMVPDWLPLNPNQMSSPYRYTFVFFAACILALCCAGGCQDGVSKACVLHIVTRASSLTPTLREVGRDDITPPPP